MNTTQPTNQDTTNVSVIKENLREQYPTLSPKEIDNIIDVYKHKQEQERSSTRFPN